MGEPTTIVIENYPVDKLPDELRRGLQSGRMVRVTVEHDPAAPKPPPLRPLTSYFGAARGVYPGHEAVTSIRRLRDE